jgi:hypothetical protein
MTTDNTGLDPAIVKTISAHDNANTSLAYPVPASLDPASNPRDPGWQALQARIADLDAAGQRNT